MQPLGKERAPLPQGGQGRRHGVFHQVDKAANKIKGTPAEGKFQPLIGPEHIGDHGEGRTLDLGEQQCRTTMSDDPSVDLGDFKVRIHRFIDGQQLIMPSQQVEIIAQIEQCGHGMAALEMYGLVGFSGGEIRRERDDDILRLTGGCA